jgi:Flp pilus assembly protein protease CpaA
MLGDMVSTDWPTLIIRIALTLWLIAISVWDRMQQRVPNVLVLPVMFGALGWQVYLAVTSGVWGRVWFALLAWVVLFMLWKVNVFGGGDSKLVMALFALFPEMSFLVLFCAVVIIVSIPLLINKYTKRGLRETLKGAGRRMAKGPLLPTAEELHTQGSPHCWSLALPGVIYLWLPL